MIVLGFDTATPATVVGLRLADGTALQARDDPAADRSRVTLASGEHPRFDQRPGHTARLLPLASELLERAGLRWGEIERIAVGVGPGTFTGLRIGVATARGLAQSLGIDVVGVSTLRVLAEAALGMSLPAPDLSPPARVLAAIDARRGEAFVAAYASEGELTPPRTLAPEELAGIPALAETGTDWGDTRFARIPKSASAAGECLPASAVGRCLPAAVGGDHDWLAVGDGALRFRGYLEAIAIAVPAEDSPLHRVDAGVLCELALSAPAGAPEAVLPDYRRRPDAEIALETAENQK